MTKSPKSIAGRVLATGEATDAEAKTLAAAVLSNVAQAADEPENTASDRAMQHHAEKSVEEMQRLLAKIDGQEGQRERADMLRELIGAAG